MGIKVIASNKKAFHDYHIGDRFEAGLSLVGTEVKALRAGKVNLNDGWVDIEDGSAFLTDVHVGHYSHGNQMNHEMTRKRRMLLSKREIRKLERALEEKGFAVVPTKIYFSGRWIKVEVALAKGKKNYDKRESNKKRDAKRQIERALKG